MNCWDESKLSPNPAALPTTANYGEAVAASDRWLVVMSGSDNLTDGSGNVTQSQIGSLSIFDKNNLSLTPFKLFMPNAVGGGSTGDSTAAVAISGDLIAASRINRLTGKGLVYLFAFSNGTWNQVSGTPLQQPMGQDKQRFGNALSFSSTGILVVGAPRYAQNEVVSTANGDLSGRVYVYTCNSGGCSYNGNIQNTQNPGSLFGSSVSISGNRVAVGAPYLQSVTNNRGEGYVAVYDINTSSFSASLVGNRILSVVAESSPGVLSSTISNPAPSGSTATGRLFGASVSLYGNKLIVGAPYQSKDAGGGNISAKTGAAYFYADLSSNTSVALSLNGAAADSRYGNGVALNVAGAFVGCPYCQSNMGQVSYHKYNSGGSIATGPTRNIFPLDRINRDGFGNAVFATDSDLVVGASNRTVGSSSTAGAGYRYGIVP